MGVFQLCRRRDSRDETTINSVKNVRSFHTSCPYPLDLGELEAAETLMQQPVARHPWDIDQGESCLYFPHHRSHAINTTQMRDGKFCKIAGWEFLNQLTTKGTYWNIRDLCSFFSTHNDSATKGTVSVYFSILCINVCLYVKYV